MKQILLPKGLVALVDDEDYDRISQYKWHAQYNPRTRSWYAIRGKYVGNGHQKTVRMSREIMRAETKQLIDHWNHDTLDNRKQNLRVCSNNQNQHNQCKHIGVSSRYKGVSWRQRGSCGRWIVTIKIKDESVYLGSFKEEKEAALAYNKSASTHFGAFACLNVIE